MNRDPETTTAPPLRLEGRRVHLLGIGGCGMSGLARLIRARGGVVTGSDQQRSPVTDALTDEGFPVRLEPEGALPEDTELLVVSAAVRPDHPQWVAAESRGVPTMTYAQALGACMRGRTGVAIAGTHGKSTTAAMLGHTLVECGLDPAVLVGAVCEQLSARGLPPSGFRLGTDTIPAGPRAGEPGVLVAEACEFNRSFHQLRPVIATIGSVEADHLDVYGSLDAVVEAFGRFARLLPPAHEGGHLIIAHDGAHRREVCAGVDARVQSLGFAPGADWTLAYSARDRAARLTGPGGVRVSWTASLPGEHNALNGAFALATALSLGADPGHAGRALSGFRGLSRRLEFLGDVGGVRVFDDYGHHPTEIDATLRAVRESERPHDRGGRLVCVFQPHQHSRTRFLLDEFAQSFSQADVVIVPQIYFVRDSENELARVCAGDLVDRLRSRGVRAMHLYPFDAIVEQLQVVCRPGDVLVVMGAGPVWEVARAYCALQTPAPAGDPA